MRSVDLAILNYNGRRHLEHLLPTALAEAENYGGVCRVVVVDNHSAAEETEWIASRFPEVVVWRAPANDFLFSYNAFAAHSPADVIVLLNNDLKLCPGFIEPLIRRLEDDVFAVGATSRDWDNREFTCGPAHLRFAHGSYSWGYDYGDQTLQHTLFTSGGFMAVDRAKFLELGGFDRLYHPAYCEDVDLCFRAWRRGWRCVFEPASLVLHRETGSWDTAGQKKVNSILLRNTLLFQWSCLPMDRGRAQRWISTAKVMAGTLLAGNIDWISTYFSTWAFWRLHSRGDRLGPVKRAELDDILGLISAPVREAGAAEQP